MNNEINEVILELEQKVRQMPREQVAYRIIKLYTQADDISAETRNRFWRWLSSPDNAEAKEKALERFFNEILTGISRFCRHNGSTILHFPGSVMNGYKARRIP